MTAPVVVEHDGVLVVRDDLYPGGSKARFLPVLYDDNDEWVYASPPQGGAQTALAWVARSLGKRATIFAAARAQPHARQLMAAALGARMEYRRPGYLNVIQARARAYCMESGAQLVPFGCDIPEAVPILSAAARMAGLKPREVWCAAGSGVLARALMRAWPEATFHVVQIGRALLPMDVPGARIHVYPLPFEKPGLIKPPFPSDPHYDAKAYELCLAMDPARKRKGKGDVLFWNVTGPADPCLSG